MWIYLKCSDHLICSRELAEFQLLYQNIVKPSLIAKSTLIVKASSCKECKKGICPKHQFGMISEHLTPRTWKLSTSSSAASRNEFLAKTSALQDVERAWQESEAGFFSKSLDCVAKYDQVSSSLKTYLPLLQEEALEWLAKLPRWGMIVDGALYPLHPSERYTKGNAGSYLPTPDASDSSRGARKYNRKGKSQSERTLTSYAGGKINPTWLEKVMGYPINWTELKPLETL